VSVRLLPSCRPPAIPKNRIFTLPSVDLREVPEIMEVTYELVPEKVVKKIARAMNIPITKVQGKSFFKILLTLFNFKGLSLWLLKFNGRKVFT
jgi:hypothetical protein